MAIKYTTTKRKKRYFKCLVYSPPGYGKTVLCATAPKPLIICAERGDLSLDRDDFDEIPVIEIENLDDLKEVYEDIKKGKYKKFETICIDSISDIAEVILSSFKKGVTDKRQAYLQLNDEIDKIVKKFRNLKKHHVYMTAKECRMEDPHSGITQWAPDMPGKQLKKNLPYLFDFVFALRISEEDEDGETYRYLQTQPSLQHYAKSRSIKFDEIERPHLGKIFNKVLKNKKDKKQRG